MNYTETEREMALDIYRTQGATAAAQAIGCSRQTIYDWLADSLSTDALKKEAAEEALTRQAVLRVHAQNRLLFTYLRLIDRCTEETKIITKEGKELTLPEPSAEATQKLATAAAILIDKFRLEMGEATSRSELTDASKIDLELARTVEEWRNQTHADRD